MLVLVMHLYSHVLMCHDVLLYPRPWVLSDCGEIQQKLNNLGDFFLLSLVNSSKIRGMDGVFQELAGLLHIFPHKIHGRFCIGLPKMHRSFVLAFLKCTYGSVWTHLNGTYSFHRITPWGFQSICSQKISIVREFCCTIAIMQEKHHLSYVITMPSCMTLYEFWQVVEGPSSN